MTKTKNTKHLIITTSLALILCLATLFGTTFAWFTQTATSGTNTVQSATYNVTLTWCDSYGGEYAPLASAELFDDTDNTNTLMPGGATGVKYIKITNSNGYAVKASAKVASFSSTGTSAMLLHSKVVDAATTVPSLGDGVSLAEGATILSEQTINANSSVIVAIAVELPQTATEAGVVDTFTIIAGATQTQNNGIYLA